jgi:Holliday junction resolvase
LKKPGRENGRKLSEATLTQIIVFNKRRGGEAYLEVKKKI